MRSPSTVPRRPEDQGQAALMVTIENSALRLASTAPRSWRGPAPMTAARLDRTVDDGQSHSVKSGLSFDFLMIGTRPPKVATDLPESAHLERPPPI